MKPIISPEIDIAIRNSEPVVALESTVIAHGLPYPGNLETAREMESMVRENGAIPATIAVLNGVVHIGLNDEQIEFLATAKNVRKMSRRDLPIVVAKQQNGATTVATTAFLANYSGIKVFATGGIGGVHRGYSADVSADLPELAQTPMIVICSGAKIVLDLPATREWLETYGISVLGWQCDEMPGFYVRSCGLTVDERVENAREVADIGFARGSLGISGAVLVTVPVPEGEAMDRNEVEELLAEALEAAEAEGIVGKDITPFLLSQMTKRSSGRTLKANISLLKNNARIAALIAHAISARSSD